MALPGDPRFRTLADPLTIDEVFIRSTPGQLARDAVQLAQQLKGPLRDVEQAGREAARERARGENDTRRGGDRVQRDLRPLDSINRDQAVDGVGRSSTLLGESGNMIANLPPVPAFIGDPPEFVDPHDFKGWPGELGRQPPGPDGEDRRDPDERPDGGDGEGPRRPPHRPRPRPRPDE